MLKAAGILKDASESRVFLCFDVRIFFGIGFRHCRQHNSTNKTPVNFVVTNNNKQGRTVIKLLYKTEYNFELKIIKTLILNLSGFIFFFTFNMFHYRPLLDARL